MTPNLRFHCCHSRSPGSPPSDDLPPNRPSAQQIETPHPSDLTPSRFRLNIGLNLKPRRRTGTSSPAATSSGRPTSTSRARANSRRSSGSSERIHLVDHETCQNGSPTHHYGDHTVVRPGRDIKHHRSGHHRLQKRCMRTRS